MIVAPSSIMLAHALRAVGQHRHRLAVLARRGRPAAGGARRAPHVCAGVPSTPRSWARSVGPIVSASIPGVAAISSSRLNASFVSSMIVTCTRAFACAVCSASGAYLELGVGSEAVHAAVTERRVTAARARPPVACSGVSTCGTWRFQTPASSRRVIHSRLPSAAGRPSESSSPARAPPCRPPSPSRTANAPCRSRAKSRPAARSSINTDGRADHVDPGAELHLAALGADPVKILVGHRQLISP